MRPKYLGLFAILGIMIGSAVANAADVVYPGITCRAESPDTGGTYEMNWGSVLNASATSDLNVVCPIVKTTTGFSGVGSGSTITFLDRHPTLNVTCDLRSESFINGNRIDNYTGSANSSGTGNPVEPIRAIGASQNGGQYYYMFCNIPRMSNGAKSGIVSYQITEAP
jgi:hypothetical protein